MGPTATQHRFIVAPGVCFRYQLSPSEQLEGTGYRTGQFFFIGRSRRSSWAPFHGRAPADNYAKDLLTGTNHDNPPIKTLFANDIHRRIERSSKVRSNE